VEEPTYAVHWAADLIIKKQGPVNDAPIITKPKMGKKQKRHITVEGMNLKRHHPNKPILMLIKARIKILWGT
jgi:hypothetical protein